MCPQPMKTVPTKTQAPENYDQMFKVGRRGWASSTSLSSSISRSSMPWLLMDRSKVYYNGINLSPLAVEVILSASPARH